MWLILRVSSPTFDEVEHVAGWAEDRGDAMVALDLDLSLHREPRRLLGGLEERPRRHVETEIGNADEMIFAPRSWPSWPAG